MIDNYLLHTSTVDAFNTDNKWFFVNHSWSSWNLGMLVLKTTGKNRRKGRKPLGTRWGSNNPGGGGGVLPYKRLMGMRRWKGSHFHNWIDYNGVAFSIELLEWGRTFSDFLG